MVTAVLDDLCTIPALNCELAADLLGNPGRVLPAFLSQQVPTLFAIPVI